MTMIVAYMGDLVMTVTHHPSLDRLDPMPYHTTLHFRDVATGKYAEISAATEMEGVLLASAWLLADEDNIGILEPYRKTLAESLTKDFMP